MGITCELSPCCDILEISPETPLSLLSITISYLIMPSLPFDKLNETNYDDWKIQMEAFLEGKGLFGVVSGRDIMPTTGPNFKGVRTFLEKQRLARSKIILSIDPSQLPHVRNEENSFVICVKKTYGWGCRMHGRRTDRSYGIR